MRKRFLSMAKAGVLFGMLALCPVQKAQAASFDCGKATTKVEKLICKDAELSKQDEELNEAYVGVLKKDSDVIGTKESQRNWIKERNRCSDFGCLREQYRQRLVSLNMEAPVYTTIYPADLAEFQADCGNTKVEVEQVLCKQAGSQQEKQWMAEMESRMRTSLQWALMRTKDKQQVLESQRKWQREVRNSCTDFRRCSKIYDERSDELATMSERPGNCYTLKPFDDGSGHISVDEQGNIPPIEPVCQAMEENLNQFCDQPPMACGLKVAPRFQEQISFPEWVPLKPVANLGLIEEFVRAPWEFDTNKGAAEPIWQAERLKIEAALADRRLTFSKAKLDLYNLGKVQPAYRLDFGTCMADNPQLASDHTQWREPITPARIRIQQAPEVIRQLFREYEPIGRAGATETFFYGGQTYSFGMIQAYGGKNSLDINRHERWTISEDLRIKLHLKNICLFDYQPTTEEEK